MMSSHFEYRSTRFHRWPRWAVVAVAASVFLAGCSDRGTVQVVHGVVTSGDQPVDAGEVRLVPVDGTLGPVNSARIVDGNYRFDARGGVPVGSYRVEIDAMKRTGRRKVETFSAEKIEVDETERVGSTLYAGESSPLSVVVPTSDDGRFNIELSKGPRR